MKNVSLEIYIKNLNEYKISKKYDTMIIYINKKLIFKNFDDISLNFILKFRLYQ